LIQILESRSATSSVNAAWLNEGACEAHLEISLGVSTMRNAFFAAVAAVALAAPGYATVCSLSDITPAAIACAGGYAGNIMNNNAANVATQQTALASLGFNWDGNNFGSFEYLSPLNGATNIDFTQMLYGITFVGIHVGGKGGGQTTFYKFDAGAGLDAFTLNLARSSGAVLYSTGDPTPGVPEPASWAMMLGGFGLVGGALRSRRKAAVSFG